MPAKMGNTTTITNLELLAGYSNPIGATTRQFAYPLKALQSDGYVFALNWRCAWRDLASDLPTKSDRAPVPARASSGHRIGRRCLAPRHSPLVRSTPPHNRVEHSASL